MKLYYCYETCYHMGQLFAKDKMYYFGDEADLPHGDLRDQKGKIIKRNVIRHFEPVMAGMTEEEKEKHAPASVVIKDLKIRIKEMKKIKNPTPAVKAEIVKLQQTLAQYMGNEPIDQRKVEATVLPEKNKDAEE